MKKELEFTIDRNYIAFKETLSVREAIKRLRKSASEDMIFYAYVIDNRRVLKGVLSLRSLLVAQPQKKLSEIMKTKITVVNEKMDDEEISQLFLKTRFLALPVVDDAYRLIGTMTLKDAINVVRMENIEDVLKIQGADINAFDKSPIKRIQSKLPWLITTIINGIICGLILKNYEPALKDLIALAFFIPLITAMGESVSGQSSAIALEGILLGKIKEKAAYLIILKQIIEALIIGGIIFLIVWLLSFIWLGNFIVATIVGITIIFAILFATLIGVSMPIILKKINLDPVVSSNPLVFAISDVSILIFYFTLSIWFLKKI
ncbi:MAG: magnesium transporter [Candidatus Goldbacteria bacterium]|nr:magnesium transporter [Candidatus Goldiibacteriota bacterium]